MRVKFSLSTVGWSKARPNQAKAPLTSVVFGTSINVAVLNTERDCFEFTYLSRKQGVRVKPLHLCYQIIIRKSDILHKLPVQEKPVRPSIDCDSFGDPPVPQAPHVGIAFQEKPIQSLFSDKSEGIQKQSSKVNLYFVIITSSVNKGTFSTKKDTKVTRLYFYSTHK